MIHEYRKWFAVGLIAIASVLSGCATLITTTRVDQFESFYDGTKYLEQESSSDYFTSPWSSSVWRGVEHLFFSSLADVLVGESHEYKLIFWLTTPDKVSVYVNVEASDVLHADKLLYEDQTYKVRFLDFSSDYDSETFRYKSRLRVDLPLLFLAAQTCHEDGYDLPLEFRLQSQTNATRLLLNRAYIAGFLLKLDEFGHILDGVSICIPEETTENS